MDWGQGTLRSEVKLIKLQSYNLSIFLSIILSKTDVEDINFPMTGVQIVKFGGGSVVHQSKVSTRNCGDTKLIFDR